MIDQKCYELANEIAKRLYQTPTDEQIFDLADRVRAEVNSLVIIKLPPRGDKR